MHAKGATARARDLAAWWVEPEARLGAQWQAPFVAGLAERLADATLDDCVYAGFEFDAAREPLRGSVVHHGVEASIEFSAAHAAARHRAVCIGWIDDATARVWVDGSALAVPADDDAWPQANPHASGWCGERWYFIETAGLFSHPGQDAASTGRLSTMRGLLVWDAELKRQRIELPRDGERWTSPRLRLEDNRLCVYATRDAVGDGSPAREIALPWNDASPQLTRAGRSPSRSG